MTLIDSHVHLDSLNKNTLDLISMAGVEAVMNDAAANEGLAGSAASVIQFMERMLDYDTRRASQSCIKAFNMVGLNMYGIPADYQKVLEVLPEFVAREGVYGLGEIGMDPKSRRCPDLGIQEEILAEELRLANEYDKAVLLHLPTTDPEAWITKYVQMMDAAGLAHRKAVMTHATKPLLKLITGMGCNAAITVTPMRQISPGEALKWLEGEDTSRILINSDSILQHPCDPLAIPKTALEMRKLEEDNPLIRQVLFENPKTVFNLPL